MTMSPLSTRSRRIAVTIAAAGAVLVSALGVGAAVAYAGDIPRGTTVLGVDLGGKNRAEASAALRTGLDAQAERLGAPQSVRVGGQAANVKPADVGLAVDVDETVDRATNRWPNPLALFGRRTVDPAVTVDEGRLAAALAEPAERAGAEMTLPAITFDGTTPKPMYPKAGKGLDVADAADAIRDGWLRRASIDVPLHEVDPKTTAADVDRLVEEFAKPAVAAPVTVTTERGNVTVSPAAIAKSLVLASDAEGTITPRVDEPKLRTALKSELAKVEIAPKEASIAVEGGTPKILASTGGRLVDTAKLSTDLVGVLPKAAPRTVAGSLVVKEASTTEARLAELGIKEQVSTFTTKFTGGLESGRSKNIVQVSKEVDGAIVKPGETFSLNGHTGPRGYEQGYHDAPVIIDGKLTPAPGGGISQFTTTLFNASYYAGFEDVEHQPHSYYFTRYPSVIESTIFYPSLDFRFRNDTPYGVLVDTSYTKDSITVSMWSTKVYDSVKTEWSERRNITKPKTEYLTPGPKCIATAGSEGFTQDAWRIFRKDGKEIKREKFTWRYDAEPRFICAKAPTGAADADKEKPAS